MKKKVLAITNVVLLVATLVVNYLATALPIAGMTTGDLSDLYPNLFVPAGFTFSIWGVIYLLLIGFAIWQLIDAWKKESLGIAKKIGGRFILSCLANIGWIFARHHQQIVLSLVLMLTILVSLIVISKKVKTGKKRGSTLNKTFTQVPFGVYLGWISVATIANVSTLLVDIQWNMWGMTDVFWTMIVIGVATLLGIAQLYKSYNIPFVLVLLRAFYGIIAKRLAIDPVYASSIIRMLGICSTILAGFIGRRREKWRAN